MWSQPTVPIYALPFIRPIVDWTHPLSRGLILSAFNSLQDVQGPAFDYVRKKVPASDRNTGTPGNGPGIGNRGPARHYVGGDLTNWAFDFSFGQRFTVAMWLYWDAYASDNKHLMYYGPNIDAGNGGLGFGIVPNSSSGTGGFLLAFGDGSGTRYNIVRITRPAVGWMHLLFTIDTSNSGITYFRNIRFNNVETVGTVSQNSTATTMVANNTLRLFTDSAGTNAGNGRIQHLCIWSRLLGIPEFQIHYQTPLAMFSPIPNPIIAFGPLNPVEASRWFLAA